MREGLLRIVDVLTGTVVGRVASGTQNAAPTTHEARTAIKKLRALLRLIRPAVSQQFFEAEDKRLKGAAARLAFARDAEVTRETLRSLASPNQSEQETLSSVFGRFDAEVDPPEDLGKTIEEVGKALEETRQQFHDLQFAATDRDVIQEGLLAVYRQGKKRMLAAIETGQDDAFHRWRIRAKNLYYELRFLESIWPKRLEPMVARLAELQDVIGRDHDLAVLRAWLKKNPNPLGGPEAVRRVVHCLDNESRKLRCAAIPLGRKIWKEKPRRFVRGVGRHWRKR